jgi:hypothetical protein
MEKWMCLHLSVVHWHKLCPAIQIFTSPLMLLIDCLLVKKIGAAPFAWTCGFPVQTFTIYGHVVQRQEALSCATKNKCQSRHFQETKKGGGNCGA